jgi:hypothetical protein
VTVERSAQWPGEWLTLREGARDESCELQVIGNYLVKTMHVISKLFR